MPDEANSRKLLELLRSQEEAIRRALVGPPLQSRRVPETATEHRPRPLSCDDDLLPAKSNVGTPV